MKILITVIALSFIVTFVGNGCKCSDTPSKKDIAADRVALKDSCRTAYATCSEFCDKINGSIDCNDGCEGGLNACVANLDHDQPRDWQPADAFYDGCVDHTADGFLSVCSSGQSKASCASQYILRKYGTISSCP